jgi:hypothetical protein
VKIVIREKKIFILLTDTETILTRLIKSYTKKPYNHASIAFDAELMEVYSFGRKSAKNPFIGGFVREDIDSVIFRQADCALYSLNITAAEFQKMYQYIQEIASEKEKYRYNFIGLFGVLFQKPIKRKNAFFCSQFVASVLKVSKVIDFEDEELSLVKPSDLTHLANFELVFEGGLNDYQGIIDEEIQVPCQLVPIKM